MESRHPTVLAASDTVAPVPGTAAQDPRASARPPRSSDQTAPRSIIVARGVAGVIGFLALWEVVARYDLLPRDVLPPASTTLVRSAELLGDPSFLGQIGATLWAAFVGYVLALVIAVPAGLVLGLSDRLHAATATVVELLRPLPPVGLVPLLVLVVGQGVEMKAVVVALGCVWPLLINTIHGVHSTDGTARATARSFGWSPRTVALRVVWPSAVPSVLTGVRITVSVALILCVGAEFIGGSRDGLGSWLLQQSMLPGGIDTVCAGVVVAGALGLLVNAAVTALERRFAAWAHREDS
jgi:NitT/TauT family transport system permease protein